jgi:hypothetical protein
MRDAPESTSQFLCKSWALRVAFVAWTRLIPAVDCSSVVAQNNRITSSVETLATAAFVAESALPESEVEVTAAFSLAFFSSFFSFLSLRQSAASCPLKVQWEQTLTFLSRLRPLSLSRPFPFLDAFAK